MLVRKLSVSSTFGFWQVSQGSGVGLAFRGRGIKTVENVPFHLDAVCGTGSALAWQFGDTHTHTRTGSHGRESRATHECMVRLLNDLLSLGWFASERERTISGAISPESKRHPPSTARAQLLYEMRVNH